MFFREQLFNREFPYKGQKTNFTQLDVMQNVLLFYTILRILCVIFIKIS